MGGEVQAGGPLSGKSALALPETPRADCRKHS